MKKFAFIIALLFTLSACQPTDLESTQQYETQRICKNLIDGILKVTQQANFQLWQQKEISTQHTEYWYRQNTEHGVILGLPKSASLKFECENTPKRYIVKKLDNHLAKSTLLSLEKIKLK